jgi:RimJ/RimL family protein N-acetyltransferase
MVPADLDFVADMLGHPEVNRHYERSFSRADSEAWLQRQRARYERDGHGLWLVSLRADGTPVGQVGLAMQEVEGERRPEIGWLLYRPFWGQGYATEAAAATRDLAFERWRYPEVISLIRPVNEPSQRVALRIGMRPTRRAPFHGFEHIVFQASAPAGAPRP